MPIHKCLVQLHNIIIDSKCSLIKSGLSAFIFFQIAVFGHNEDGIILANSTSYIIDAEVMSNNETTETFVAFCYSGQLCSTTFGYSESARKVFSSNALFPKNINTDAVGE